MVIESFLVTALPRTADPARAAHVSLFVTHRLTPDGGTGVVGDFPHVAKWAALLEGAEFELRGHLGGVAHVIPATAALTRLETTLWPLVFPPDLAVRPWVTADPAAEEWRSFPAHRMQEHALLTHAAAVFSSPVDSPGVSGNVLTRLLLDAIGLRQFEGRIPLDLLLDDDFGLDRRVTDLLNEITEGGRSSPSGDRQPLLALAGDVHRARLYYERPAEQRAYLESPDPKASPPPVVKPDPDFHERASMLGDLSPLLRRLGLVVDLHIDDLAALAGVTEISASILVPGLDNPIRNQPRTACVVDGRGFWASSASGDHHRGLLRLGDEERFRVLDLDPDAAALKLEQYVRNLPRMSATEENGDPASSAPASLRASGFAIARLDRSDRLQSQLSKAPAKDQALLTGTAPPLTIEDLARGLRLEVWDDVSAQWHSLHRRRIHVEVTGAGTVLKNAADTGFLQGAALTRSEDPDGQTVAAPYYAHEVLAGWEGWSLSVPKPGKVLIRDGDDPVDAPDPDPDPVHPVATTTHIEPLTLPWLRYGRNYAFRAWTVDLAGNSTPHRVAGPAAADPDEPATPAIAAARASRRPSADPTDLAHRAARGRLDTFPATPRPPPTGRFATRCGRGIRSRSPAPRAAPEPAVST